MLRMQMKIRKCKKHALINAAPFACASDFFAENNSFWGGGNTARLEWLLSPAIIGCMKGQGCLLTPGESRDGAGGARLWSRDNFVQALRQLCQSVCVCVCVLEGGT